MQAPWRALGRVQLELGKRYGWPHVYADGGINPQSTPPGGITKEQWRDNSELSAGNKCQIEKLKLKI